MKLFKNIFYFLNTNLYFIEKEEYFIRKGEKHNYHCGDTWGGLCLAVVSFGRNNDDEGKNTNTSDEGHRTIK